jgi:hypothetical protein
MHLQAHRGGRSSNLTNLQPSSRRKWMVSIMCLPLYARERPNTHCTGGCVGLGATQNGTEILPPLSFNPPSAQSMVSHCTNYDLLATIIKQYLLGFPS